MKKDKRERWGGLVGRPRPNKIKIRKEKGWTIQKELEQRKILKELGEKL